MFRMSKQSTLGFGNKNSSSSSSHVSNNVYVCWLNEIQIALSQIRSNSSVHDTHEDFQNRRRMGLGWTSLLFAKGVVSNPSQSGTRSTKKVAKDLIVFDNQPVRAEINVMLQALQIINTNASGLTTTIGDAVHKFILNNPRDVCNCIPELQMRDVLLQSSYTQVKNKNGAVVGVRAPWPCCQSNTFVSYDKLRVRPIFVCGC